jgi:hypothetical protein
MRDGSERPVVRPTQVPPDEIVFTPDAMQWAFSSPAEPQPLQALAEAIRAAQSRLFVSTSAEPEVSLVRAILASPAPWKVVVLGHVGLPWRREPAALTELCASFAARPSVDGDGLFAMGSLTPDGGAWLTDSVIVDERWVYDGPLWLPRQGRSLTVWYDSTVAAPAMQAAYLDALAGSPRIRPEDYEACPACGRWVTPEERVLQDGEVGCEGCTEADHGAPDVDVGVPEGIAPA